MVFLTRGLDEAPEDAFDPRAFAHVQELETVEEVDLVPYEGPPVTDADLAYLRKLRRIRRLSIANSPITDEGLGQLTGLVNLEELCLYNTCVTGKGLAHFSRRTTLRTLDMNCDPMIAGEFISLRQDRASSWVHAIPLAVTDSAFKSCAAFRQLRVLRLHCEGVCGDNLRHLRRLQSLEYLCCTGLDIRPGDLKHLQALPKLTTLNIEFATLSDDALADVGGLVGLRILDMSNTAITDAGLVHLAGLRSLEHLQLRRTRVTARGLAQLSKLPKLSALYWDEIPPRSVTRDSATFPWNVHKY